MTIPTVEPTCFTAGDTLKFKRKHADYVPPTWALTYVLVSPDAQISFTSSDNGDGYHLINVTAAETASWAPGEYNWQASVSDGTDRYTVWQGQMRVAVNIAIQNAGYDGRSIVKQTLDALRAAMLRRASQDQLSYAIGGRSISQMTHAEIREQIDTYEWLYQREQAADGLGRGQTGRGKVRVRM